MRLADTQQQQADRLAKVPATLAAMNRALRGKVAVVQREQDGNGYFYENVVGHLCARHSWTLRELAREARRAGYLPVVARPIDGQPMTLDGTTMRVRAI